LKIRTELDLRGGKAASALPGIPRYELIPFSAYATWGGTPGQGIFSDAMRPQVKKIFELFADPSAYPLYFHCQGGGDRTGTVAFLLENMLGVNDADSLTEYELSNLSVSGERSRFSEVWTKFMEKLETIVPGGSRQEQVCEFLRQCGVADAVQEKIRSILLIHPNQYSEKRIEMKKSRYIDLMEKVLSAYTEEHIDRYYHDVRTGGLKEHGFPRLTADIGILIAHGRRTDLKERLAQMMDLCCDEMSAHKGCANDFSVKEIIFAIMELEKNRTFPQKQIDSWKEKLKKIEVEKCYDVFAVNEDSIVYNWAAFTMLSEWMRYQLKLAPVDMRFIDIQAASQWHWVEGNGMYRDPSNPMVYDLVPRGLFSLLIHFGYRGKYYERWDCALKKAGLFTLKMVSVTGEIPYGGRSNQFPHNEAHLVIIMEYEAARYARLGDLKTAGQCKAVVRRALDSIESWLASQPIYHVKNRFPRDTKYGCEGYAYFDKYMITTASFLYAAYLVCDESIPAGELDDMTGDTWQTSEHFHKLFLRAGNYFAEYDYKADYHYDASGLGRLHRKGAPSVICLSTPGSDTPAYTINAENPAAFAIVPEVLEQDKWLSGAAREVVHQVRNHSAQGSRAQAEVICRWPEKREVKSAYLLSEDGLQIDLEGQGGIGLMLPAFQFDGTEKCEIENSGKVLTVKYRNWVCRYRTENGSIRDSGKTGYNRNGHYKLFRAEGKDQLTVKIDIFPASNQ
ncbi:MAG: tyrosine-protein phosphatase, partial [Lentisphaeria bacterium]|nr:tyrosine-protein phosphatase [Lentisphaeria bacterium]